MSILQCYSTQTAKSNLQIIAAYPAICTSHYGRVVSTVHRSVTVMNDCCQLVRDLRRARFSVQNIQQTLSAVSNTVIHTMHLCVHTTTQ